VRTFLAGLDDDFDGRRALRVNSFGEGRAAARPDLIAVHLVLLPGRWFGLRSLGHLPTLPVLDDAPDVHGALAGLARVVGTCGPPGAESPGNYQA
jgi:hypothetical protein